MGIEVFAAKDCEVFDNIIYSTMTTGLGIRSAGGLDNLFHDNLIRGFNSGFSLQGGSGPTEPCHRPMIIDNRVIGVLGASATSILLVNDIQDALIEGNYLDDFVYGVWLKTDTAGGSDRAKVKRNTLRTSASTTHAIFGSPPTSGQDVVDPQIINNEIDASAGGNGIYLDACVGRIHIRRNTVEVGSGGDAIQHVNSPAGTETYSRMNTIVGAGVLKANDNKGSGSGKYIEYNSQGIDDNSYIQTDGADEELALFSPAQLTGNVDDYDPLFGSGRVVGTWRLTSDASRDISSIAGGRSGRRLTIINVGSNNIVLRDESAALGTAANRIITGTGASITLAANGKAHLIYDDTTARWRVV
jgi:hypothetical protein